VLRPPIEPSQYRSGHFQGSLSWLGIEDDAAFVGEPQGNGVAERFMRTIKEQCLWSRLFDDVDDLRLAVAAFIETYNNEWLIERLGHRTPREAFMDATAAEAA
jgi:putative transposase